jgi:hypothetical protein
MKTTPDAGVVAVTFAAVLTNATPFEPHVDAVPFPMRCKRALGAGVLLPIDRVAVLEYLNDLGIPAPEGGGSALYDRCPAVELHDSRCCYVNSVDGGDMNVHCLGGHGGDGPKHWTMSQLAVLAGLATGAGDVFEGFDPMTDLPVTDAAIEFIRHQLDDWSEASVEAVLELWTREWARTEAARLNRAGIACAGSTACHRW